MHHDRAPLHQDMELDSTIGHSVLRRGRVLRLWEGRRRGPRTPVVDATPPDPAEELNIQMQQKQMEIQERQTQIAELKAQQDASVAQARLNLDQMKAEKGFAIQSDTVDLKEAQLEHKTATDLAELEILRNAEDVRGIASPTG